MHAYVHDMYISGEKRDNGLPCDRRDGLPPQETWSHTEGQPFSFTLSKAEGFINKTARVTLSPTEYGVCQALPGWLPAVLIVD